VIFSSIRILSNDETKLINLQHIVTDHSSKGVYSKFTNTKSINTCYRQKITNTFCHISNHNKSSKTFKEVLTKPISYLQKNHNQTKPKTIS